jgi:16S rRNA (cytosine1402-N4)-methyltransferase
MERQQAHTSVLRDEVVELLCPVVFLNQPVTIVDCTLGLAGHAKAMLDALGPQAQLIGLDVDESNLARAKDVLIDDMSRVRLFQANFSELTTVLEEVGVSEVHVVLADLGVASTQIDDPERGMSFQAEGPLDMRMDARLARTAADLVNHMDEVELADIIYLYGEERLSRKIARRIVTRRTETPFETTSDLAYVVRGCYPPKDRRGRIHPATRTFQALRIAVNDEMGVLDRLLAQLPDVLTPGGRAGIISFHSLEDRPVKQAFSHLDAIGAARIMTKKPIRPSDTEVRDNPRSRSAKLRVIERMHAQS